MGSNGNLSDRNQAQFWSVLQGMMDKVGLRCVSYAKTLVHDKRIISVRFSERSVPEITWQHQAIICCFYYHLFLGNKNETRMAMTFKMKASTVRGCASKQTMVPKWIVFAKQYNVFDILRHISEP